MLGLEDHTAYDKTTRWGLEKGPKLQKNPKIALLLVWFFMKSIFALQGIQQDKASCKMWRVLLDSCFLS